MASDGQERGTRFSKGKIARPHGVERPVEIDAPDFDLDELLGPQFVAHRQNAQHRRPRTSLDSTLNGCVGSQLEEGLGWFTRYEPTIERFSRTGTRFANDELCCSQIVGFERRTTAGPWMGRGHDDRQAIMNDATSSRAP